MVNSTNYNGVISITKNINGKKLSTKIFNKGTTKLFEIYAKAIAGVNTSNELPCYINFRYNDNHGEVTEEDTQKIKKELPNTILISNGLNILKSVLLKEEDNGNDTEIGTHVPCTRISSTLISSVVAKNNMNGFGDNLNLYITLENINKDILAYAKVPETLFTSIKNLSIGTQLLIVWDMYVQNNTQTN